MSSTAAALDRRAAPRDADTRPGLDRLTAVELRKMVDTRAGFWLLLATAALTVAVVVLIGIFGNDEDRTFRNMASSAVEPSAILLPIVGILLVSSEWSQRTALITFTLVPNRPRVLAAKLLAAIVLSLVALVVVFATAALGTAIASGGVPDVWRMPGGQIGQLILYLTTGVIIGVGFGAALLSSAPAIVLSFALPLAWSALGIIPWLDGPADWLDTTRTTAPFTEGVATATEWAQLGTSLALWLVLPLAIGLWRVARGEIRAG